MIYIKEPLLKRENFYSINVRNTMSAEEFASKTGVTLEELQNIRTRLQEFIDSYKNTLYKVRDYVGTYVCTAICKDNNGITSLNRFFVIHYDERFYYASASAVSPLLKSKSDECKTIKYFDFLRIIASQPLSGFNSRMRNNKLFIEYEFKDVISIDVCNDIVEVIENVKLNKSDLSELNALIKCLLQDKPILLDCVEDKLQVFTL